jgi:UDPglucose 6-dehydrogenase
MQIAVIGTGYVGLVTGVCFAELGNNVVCIDIDEQKIDNLKNGIIPIYEPGLLELVNQNIVEKRLNFSTDYRSIIDSEIIFIAVGTPSNEDGSANLHYIEEVAKSIGTHINNYKIIVNKSTVPVGTYKIVSDIINEKISNRNLVIDFDMVSNPEFLREGTAVDDFMRPDRIIIGCNNTKVENIMRKLYEPFIKNQHPFIVMDNISAELTKYAANTMLATRISFMNELANLCTKIGGNIDNIRLGIGSDSRIGMAFLYSGIGYGGSCFPKDVKELIQFGNKNNINMSIAKATEEINYNQKRILLDIIAKRFGNDLSNIKFAIWGLSFNPQTDDIRESPSLIIIQGLLNRGASVQVYDPEAMENTKKYFGNSIKYIYNMYDVCLDCDCLLLLTAWKQFRQPDFSIIKDKLNKPIIFDGRNQYNIKDMKELGFEYYSIGR